MQYSISRLVTGGILLLVMTAASGEEESLAKQSQNPVGDLISVPFEYNFEPNVGPKDGDVHTLNLKPVYPVNLGEYNLINRFILPIAHQGERFEGEGSDTGLGNLTYQAFFSPARPGKVIWGLGPAITAPSHTDDRFGSDQWSGGPALVVLAKPGNWLFGTLVQHFWSFTSESDEDDIDITSVQYFINYNMDNDWYLSSTPTMTANWEAGSTDRYFIPVGGGVGRLVRFGNQPVDFRLQGFKNVSRPKGAAEWSLQFQVKLLFPK